MAVLLQGRVSDAHLRGEAACAKLQEKLDISGAALQTAAGQHKELDKQKKAADRKLVCDQLYPLKACYQCCICHHASFCLSVSGGLCQLGMLPLLRSCRLLGIALHARWALLMELASCKQTNSHAQGNTSGRSSSQTVALTSAHVPRGVHCSPARCVT